MINIYVGNLPWNVTDEDLRERFEAHGRVDKAFVIKDSESGRSRGFAFVEMPDDEKGLSAIEAEAGTDWDGRKLTVNKAKPREERPARSSGGGGGGGGYASGGGNPYNDRGNRR